MKQEVARLIKSISKGKIFSVTYTKKDGSKRVICTMNGVHKGVTGTGLKYDAKAKGVFPMYDLNVARKTKNPFKAWRMVNVSTIESIRFDGIELRVQTPEPQPSYNLTNIF
jgi:hypothetical protein